jgi:hypothetical protein
MRIALISTAAAVAIVTAAVFAPSQAEASIASPVLGAVPQTVDPIEKAGCYRSGPYGYRWYPWCGGGGGYGWRGGGGWHGGGWHGGGWHGGGWHGGGWHGGGWHGGRGFHGGFHGGRGRR